MEEYLIKEKSHILALNELNRLIQENLNDNYYEIINGKINFEFLDKILALNTAIKTVIYCMRIQRKEFYKKIDKTYEDKFSYNSPTIDIL
ncbi:hypothetical protein IJ707_01365 [bacterium]|nr:hypothetical protein [bacterium]